MNAFRVNLTIADLTAVLCSEKRRDLVFLHTAYAPYLSTNLQTVSSSKQIMVINIHESSKSFGHTKISKNHYNIYIHDIQENFEQFNDLFRNAFTHFILRHNGVVLHGSSVVHNNHGYIFVGQEGSGKSTIRKLLSPLPSLGDDSAIIRFVHGETYLYGSPFYQKTQRLYPNKRVKIAGCFKLQKSPSNMIYLMTREEAIRLITGNAVIAKPTISEKTYVLNAAITFGTNIPCFSLWFSRHKAVRHIVFESSALHNTVIRTDLIAHIDRVIHLPDDVVWHQAIATKMFLGTCRVICDTSWLFEFGNKVLIKDVAPEIKKKKFNSPHKYHIMDINKQSIASLFHYIPIAIVTDSSITLIDGNHHAVAQYIRAKLNTLFPLLVGISESQQFDSFVNV